MSDDKTQLALVRDQQLAKILEPAAEARAYLQRMAPERAERVRNSLASMKHGLHAVAPLTCGGPHGCPFVKHCPIPTQEEKASGKYGDIEDYPVALPCVLEQGYQRQKIVDYVQHLDVQLENPVEMSIVNELAIIDLHKNRALMIMSEGDRDGDGRDFLRQDLDYTETADAYELVKTTSLHPAFDVLDRLEKRRERLLERLVETRKSRIEIDIKRGAVIEDSNVLTELQKVRALLSQQARQTVDDPDVLDIPD